MVAACFSDAISRDADRASASGEHRPGAPDPEELWRRRVAEDRRYWEPRAAGAGTPSRGLDPEWLWKTITDAARRG